MKVFIASDHAGFAAKQGLLSSLSSVIAVEDLGPTELDPNDDYPFYAEKVARRVIAEPGSMGILVCKSGQGMEIAANKIDGIRAALVWNENLAKETRRDNDTNVLSLPAGELSAEQMSQIAQVWLNTPFSDETRHRRRINEITKLEQADE